VKKFKNRYVEIKMLQSGLGGHWHWLDVFYLLTGWVPK
jgi:hypothetical protein